MVSDVFPASWFSPDLLELVIDFIRGLALDPQDTKRVFSAWAEEAGVQVTGEMIERVTGLPAGEV